MSRSVNKVLLIGHLGKDPELKYFPSGDAVCNVSLATSDSWTDKNTGEVKEHTEWHNLVFRKKLAEIVAQYLKKGAKVYVEGAIRSRKYQDKNGADRYITEIFVQDMQMLGEKSNGAGQGAPQSSKPAPATAQRPPSPGAEPGLDDDIPF